MWIQWLILCSYFLALFALACWGVHRLVLLRWLSRTPKAHAKYEDFTPDVLVQLPIFNEPTVAARIIDAAAQLDWPNLHIQVLDDSTDSTTQIAEARIRFWADKGIRITHLRRTDRTGYKAGALANGLAQTTAPFVAIFDADFLPRSDFLRLMMPVFGDANVGMTQARWGHINRDQNLLTRLESLVLDGHFAVEHTARYRRGCFFNFNGTAGIWRRDCIDGAGGWSHDTITEDLDLSYRAQLCGWDFVYRDDVVAVGEVPGTMRAFLIQQHRWAKGTVQTARKLTQRIWTSSFPFVVRMEALNHLFMMAAYPAIFSLSLLFPLSLSMRQQLVDVNLGVLDLATIVVTTGSLFLFYSAALRIAGERISRRWWEIPFAMALGVGSSASQTLAVIEGLLSNDSTFVRTPKQGNSAVATLVPQIPPLQLIISCGMSLYYGISIALAVTQLRWASLPLLALFGLGFLMVSLRQILEGNRIVEAAEMGPLPATK